MSNLRIQRKNPSFVWLLPTLGIAILLGASSGCDLDSIAIELSRNTGDDNDPTANNPADGSIFVAFRNGTTDAAIDVNFYVSTEPLSQVPNDLFTMDNLSLAGIGLGSNGRLAPGVQDIIEVACADGLILGTTGGVFIDPETGEELGVGTQRWVMQGAQFDCGETIVFEYRRDGDVFSTTLGFGF